MRSGITKFVFTSTALLLLMLFALPRAGSAQEQGLLYATADAGTKLVAANLEAMRVRAIGGGIGFTRSLALAFCPPGRTAVHDNQHFRHNQGGVLHPSIYSLDLDTGLAPPILNKGTLVIRGTF